MTTLAVVVTLGACHKDAPHRAKRARLHPSPATAGNDDDVPPPAPAPPPPAPSTAPVPAAPAPVAAAPFPLPHLHHQLTVDRTVPSSPPHPQVPPAATAEPAPEYRAVTDKPLPSAAPPASASRCEGGSVKGERLSVQGVAADDVLNVREAPDKTSAILGSLPSDATGVHGTASRRRVGASTWREVECGKLRGWVNERFLARESGN